GGRAVAVVEAGAELAWTAEADGVRIDQPRGDVFYRVEHGGPLRVVTPAGEVQVTGTCFRVMLESAAAGSAALVDVLEGSVRVRSGERALPLRAGDSARLALGQAPELSEARGFGATGEPTASAELRARLREATARAERAEAQARALAGAGDGDDEKN